MSSPRQIRFTDSTGRDWLVSEHPGIPDAAPSFGPSLLFVNHGIVRRVRKYPPNWGALSSRTLASLSWQT